MPSTFIKQLRARLRIHANDKYAPLPKPTKNDLDRFEEEAGFPLPHSYRKFAMSFGAGDLARTFKITVPGAKDRAYDLIRFHRECSRLGTDDASLAYFSVEDRPRARRIVWFSLNNTRADCIGWDPLDLTDEKCHEYGIYILPHSEPVVERIAGSFPEFVGTFCLSRRGMAKFRGVSESDVPEPELSFSQVTDFKNPRKGRKPTRKREKRVNAKPRIEKKATRTKKK
jgi:hypothetical protein